MFDTTISDETTLGFVGIGQMGLPMAHNLLEAGYPVSVYDVRQEAVDDFVAAGGQAVNSPAELVTDCSAIHIGVVSKDQVDSVMRGNDGLFAKYESLNKQGLVVVHSTVMPETVSELAEDAPDGVTVIDAAMSGGKPRAETGELTLMVGGDQEATEFYRPVLEVLSRDIFHLGRVGSGLATKLSNNLIFHAMEQATLEAVELGTAYGVDQEQLLEVFEKSTGDNYFLRDFDFWTNEYLQTHPAGLHGPARNARKNLYEALELAESMQLELPMTGQVSQLVPMAWHDLADEIETSEN